MRTRYKKLLLGSRQAQSLQNLFLEALEGMKDSLNVPSHNETLSTIAGLRYGQQITIEDASWLQDEALTPGSRKPILYVNKLLMIGKRNLDPELAWGLLRVGVFLIYGKTPVKTADYDASLKDLEYDDPIYDGVKENLRKSIRSAIEDTLQINKEGVR